LQAKDAAKYGNWAVCLGVLTWCLLVAQLSPFLRGCPLARLQHPADILVRLKLYRFRRSLKFCGREMTDTITLPDFVEAAETKHPGVVVSVLR
jgi:hypothetical protein